MTQVKQASDICQDLPFSEIYSASMVFKKSTPFTLEQARVLANNVRDLIGFWLLAVPHFHNEERVANIKLRQPATPSTLARTAKTYSLALDVPGIHSLYNEREEKGVQTFLEFLVGMGEELRKGSKPRQDGTQKIEGTDAYNALFDQYEVFLRDKVMLPMKCIPGNKVSPKPKPPVGKNVATPAPKVAVSPENDAPATTNDQETPVQVDDPVQAAEYAQDQIRIQTREEQVANQIRIQKLEGQVANQKRIIEALTDIIKNDI